MNLYRRILRDLGDDSDPDRSALKYIYRLEIDLKNMVAAFKYIWEGTAPGKKHIEPFIPGGTISVGLLNDMTLVKELDEALELIERTRFHEAVEKGIIYYAETGFLHEMERFFEEVLIRKAQTTRRFHPFGIGVFLGYAWALFAEMTNLRAIITGISFKTGAGQIRKGLIHV